MPTLPASPASFSLGDLPERPRRIAMTLLCAVIASSSAQIAFIAGAAASFAFASVILVEGDTASLIEVPRSSVHVLGDVVASSVLFVSDDVDVHAVNVSALAIPAGVQSFCDEDRTGTVDVTFPPGRPDRARVTGCRRTRASLGGAAVFVPIGMVLTLLAVLASTREREALALLRYGAATTGTTTAQHADTDDDGVTSFYVTVRYRDARGAEHHRDIVTRHADRFGVGSIEPLLYDEDAPDDALLLDEIPGAPRVLRGRLVATRAVAALGRAALVATALASAATFVVIAALGLAGTFH